MANMNVTYDQMRTAADKLKNGQAEIEANLTRLRAHINELVMEGFTTSRASGAFDSSYEEFNNGATKTIQGIDGMANFLKNAANTLEQTDEELARKLGR